MALSKNKKQVNISMPIKDWKFYKKMSIDLNKTFSEIVLEALRDKKIWQTDFQ